VTSLPNFQPDGYLPPGVHKCRGEEFIRRFCHPNKYRKEFEKQVCDIQDYAASKGALAIIVGGSFVTNKPKPFDIDCAIVFVKEAQIPQLRESIQIEGTQVDIFFCCVEQKNLMDGVVRLFCTTRYGLDIGAVIVLLHSKEDDYYWEIRHEPDDTTFEIIKRVYVQRNLVELIGRNKLLITVHGIRSQAEWNAEISHIFSANGWIVAPFVYGYKNIDVLIREEEQGKIVDLFRRHIYEMYKVYHANISVISHSFGTLITAMYLLGFDDPPVHVDTWLLAGSILREDIDFAALEGKVASIYHEKAPNDKTVGYASLIRKFSHPLVGQSGRKGFSRQSSLLTERECDIFDHNNVIKRDVISQRWLPFLEANAGAIYRINMRGIVNTLRGT